ncbi:adenylate kinase 8-like [Oscarella lobularis]|uniref:adenylate kinase 8-like n=1 Tax=Oscarella lobularis TaxID=121494 RepID=UPI0033144EDC
MDATKRPLRIPPDFTLYAEKHKIFQLYERIIQELIVTQPDDPLQAIIDILKRPKDNVHRVIICGVPGSGKRTMSKLVSSRLRLVHITPKDLLNDEDSPIVQAARKSTGPISPASWGEIFRERVLKADCQNKGWVIEGFPRTREEALALQSVGVLANHFILLDVKDDVAFERNMAKRVDPQTGDVYNTVYGMPNDPKVSARLKEWDASDLSQNIQEHHRKIDGVLSCYTHIAKRINADQPKEDVVALILNFLCSSSRSMAPHTPRVVLLGPTGSGKSKQASLLASKYGLVDVSCSDIIKKAMAAGTKLGEAMKPYMERGLMIPDDLVMNALKARLSQLDCATRGWILHGYPKTPPQAELLIQAGYEPSRVFFLDVSVDSVMERLTQRRTDPLTGERYHLLSRRPPTEQVAQRLKIHPKDEEEAVLQRLHQYQANYDDIEEVFSSQSQHVNGDQDAHTVFELLESMLIKPVPQEPPPQI